MYTAVSPTLEPEKAYAEFLRDTLKFEGALQRVLQEWPISCEHFLSNEGMNRIAWLGQASMFLATGVPERYRAGFMLLAVTEKRLANSTAERFLNQWIKQYEKQS